jgi:hypothetical protein
MLEGLFADELALLQLTPGYMRLLKESVLQIWKARKAAVEGILAFAERGLPRAADLWVQASLGQRQRFQLGRSRMEMKGWWAVWESNRHPAD